MSEGSGPTLDGAATLARWRAIELHEGQIALWWLGQSGFLIRSAQSAVLIDPFLSANPDRVVAPPIAPEALTGLQVIACTHDHIDHLDKPSIPALAAASPGALFVVPTPVVSEVTALGIPAQRVRGVQPGEWLSYASVTVSPVPAAHAEHVADGYGFGGDTECRFLGYVVDIGGVRVYHAGDTIPYTGMVDRLRTLHIDVALLPVNGRDFFREEQDLVGNMNPREAVQVAVQSGADLLIPMHYDMFAANLGFPAHVVEYVDRFDVDLTVVVPSLHKPVVYGHPR